MNRSLRLAGMAKRAGRIACGDDPVGDAVRTGKVRLIFTAADAADNTIRRAGNHSERVGVPHIRMASTKDEMGEALGLKTCAIAALTDKGFAEAFTEAVEKEKGL